MTTLKEAEEWIEKQEFVYAKSYSQTFPHYYLSRRNCDHWELEQFLRLVREYGVVKGFFKKQYVYLELNGFEYWEMGRPIKCVQVLNRQQIDNHAWYRTKVAPEEALELKAKLLMRECYINTLLERKEPTPEEQRQLEFLLDTKRRIHGGGRNIIDNYKIPVRYE